MIRWRLIIAALVFSLASTACLGEVNYARPDFDINGRTDDQRVRAIAAAVQDRFQGFVAVPAAEINVGQEGPQASYLVMVTVSRETLSRFPQTAQAARAQEEALDKINDALAALLRLSTKHLSQGQTVIRVVDMTLFLPDGGVYKATSRMEQLQGIKDDAPRERWLETLSLSQQVVVPGSVWEEILQTLSEQGQEVPQPEPGS